MSEFSVASPALVAGRKTRLVLRWRRRKNLTELFLYELVFTGAAGRFRGPTESAQRETGTFTAEGRTFCSLKNLKVTRNAAFNLCNDFTPLADPLSLRKWQQRILVKNEEQSRAAVIYTFKLLPFRQRRHLELFFENYFSAERHQRASIFVLIYASVCQRPI